MFDVKMTLAMRKAGSMISGFRIKNCKNDVMRILVRNGSSFAGGNTVRGAKKLVCVMAGGLATCGSVLYLFDKCVMASDVQLKIPSYPWSTNRIIGSLDHSGIRRGWQVYRQVCATCHSIRYLNFRDLVDVAFTETEMKAIAEGYEVDDGPDDEGNYFKRPGKLMDRVPDPFPNEEAARFANNGAYPIDLSLIVYARHEGKDYVFSLLTGYFDTPAGVQLGNGQLFNAYFPGGAISMPQMLQDGVIDYDDGTPATASQMAKDVVEFLSFTAEQHYDQKKVTFLKGVGICTLLLIIATHIYKARWTSVKRTKIFFLPRGKND